jgi:hypothetical protein
VNTLAPVEMKEHGGKDSNDHIPEPERTNASRKAGSSAARPGRGGYREGSGRPAKKTKVKRASINARVPGWMADWLRAEGDVGRKIEVALIAHYGLTPPES